MRLTSLELVSVLSLLDDSRLEPYLARGLRKLVQNYTDSLHPEALTTSQPVHELEPRTERWIR